MDLFNENSNPPDPAAFRPVKTTGVGTVALLGVMSNFVSLPVIGWASAVFASMWTVTQVWKSKAEVEEVEMVELEREKKVAGKYMYFIPLMLVPFILFRRRRK